MTEIPEDLQYTEAHEWLRRRADGLVEIGVTDHAQSALGDLVFVELPAVGRALRAGEACAVVESVKSASDVYAPLSGEVVEANAALEKTPETINQDPYRAGWMIRVRPSPQGETSPTLSAAQYRRLLDEQRR
ncbi:MAG: glycine cleavage system protein GcvH [Gammaproteobacteria bacterium]|nr:glycine cleavage system protein GcvH [Gammaproteobacteria bacterium]